MLIIKASKLDKHTCDRHKVIVVHNVEIVNNGVPDVHYDIAHGLPVVAVTCLRTLQTLHNFLVGVLVLTDDQSHVRGRVLDLLREILREHVVDLDDETQSNETFDDHGKLFRLTNGDLKNNLSEDR